MGSATRLIFTRRTAAKRTRIEFICPDCGPVSFEPRCVDNASPEQIKAITDVVLKAHRQEHR